MAMAVRSSKASDEVGARQLQRFCEAGCRIGVSWSPNTGERESSDSKNFRRVPRTSPFRVLLENRIDDRNGFAILSAGHQGLGQASRDRGRHQLVTMAAEVLQALSHARDASVSIAICR
jgi:hypothetical protein